MNATTTAATTITPCDPLTSFQCLVTTGYQHQSSNMSFLADLPPPRNAAFATLQQQQEHYAWVDTVIEKHWNPGDGFFLNRNRAMTYGEVTALGTRHLSHEMHLFSSLSEAENNDKVVFVDLGSGVGRLVTQIYLDNSYGLSNFRQAIGVELSPERHGIGERALSDLLKEEGLLHLPSLQSDVPPPIQLIQEDAIEFLDTILENSSNNDSNDNITHVYMSSLCFPKDVLAGLQQRLLQLSGLQVVAALNRLDDFASFHKEWEERRHVPIQMSWGPSTVHIYERRRRYQASNE